MVRHIKAMYVDLIVKTNLREIHLIVLLTAICKGRGTSLTPGTIGEWVWLLRSRPDQVATPTCGEARLALLYLDDC